MPTNINKECNKCVLNEQVIYIIQSQYRRRTKIEVLNFIKELLYYDELVQKLSAEYKGSLNENTFWYLIDYLGLTKYIKTLEPITK